MLFYEVGRRENRMAGLLREGLRRLEVEVLVDSPTNQQFPILENTVLERLKTEYAFETIETVDPQHTCVRLVCSWATPEEAVENFLQDLKACMFGA